MEVEDVGSDLILLKTVRPSFRLFLNCLFAVMFFTLEQSPGEEKVKLTYWQKKSPHDEEGASA